MGTVTIHESTTVNPITLIGEMAGLCWGADTTRSIKNYKRGLDCIRCNHGRTMEYPQIYLVLDGYSARVIREFYTHIGGAPSRLQESTRYVDCSSFGYVVPPSVAQNVKANYIFQDTMRYISKSITQLEELGIKREDSAMLLPLGMETKVVVRTNLRNLIDMSRQRMCTRAYWEFRQLMNDILQALSDYGATHMTPEWEKLISVEKVFAPKCDVLGYCPERYGCGRKPKREEED